MGEFMFASGYWWHVPCADLDSFPRKGKMVPSTIMEGEKPYWQCEVCGKKEREKKRIKGRKRHELVR